MQRSAWKAHSPKSVCRIVHSPALTGPTSPITQSRTQKANTHMSWCRIKMHSAAWGGAAYDDDGPSRAKGRDIGAVGGLAGTGTFRRPGLQTAATPAAKFLEDRNRWERVTNSPSA